MYACSIKNEFNNFGFLCILIIITSCVLKILKQMHGCMNVNMTCSSCAPKHVWMKEEEATLVECMVEFVSARGWKSDNGTFRPGYLAQLLRMMTAKLPGCNVHETTVIDCSIKTLKRSYQAIAEMHDPSCSGFGWNDDAKCIVAEKELFDNWVRVCEKYNCTLIYFLLKYETSLIFDFSFLYRVILQPRGC